MYSNAEMESWVSCVDGEGRVEAVDGGSEAREEEEEDAIASLMQTIQHADKVWLMQSGNFDHA